ncbi:hypothetical protein J6590_107085 [Homalodisca vitripennis]|nr:hypothetical protein J6590_107085 [Homalodisca vitripennis]
MLPPQFQQQITETLHIFCAFSLLDCSPKHVKCLQERKAVSRVAYLEPGDISRPTASLRITTSVFLSEESIGDLVDTLESVCRTRLSVIS